MNGSFSSSAARAVSDFQEDSEAFDTVRRRRITLRNRRKAYLESHTDYFSESLELADPLLYDRLIRRFQSAAEREAEGRKKGYSGVLEADLARSEAKVHALANPESSGGSLTYRRGAGGEIVAEDPDEIPENKEDGYLRWRKHMEMRFINGGDSEFDYAAVDEDETLDLQSDEQRRDYEDRYFEDEEPQWVVEAAGGDGDGDQQITSDANTSHPRRPLDAASQTALRLTGETGIQDF